MGFWNKLFGCKASPPSSTGTPSSVDPRALFLEHVERLLRADGAIEQVTRLPSDYGLQAVRAGRTGTIFLHRLFADTRELSPEEREHAIQNFLATVWQLETVDTLSWEEARPRLRPTLRAVTFGLGPTPVEPGQKLVTRHPLPFLLEVLLPETDLIALRPASEDLLLVPWADVRRLAGDGLVEEPGVWPPRYRTTAWPAPEALEQLRAAARAHEDAPPT